MIPKIIIAVHLVFSIVAAVSSHPAQKRLLNSPELINYVKEAEEAYQQSQELAKSGAYGMARVKLFKSIDLLEKAHKSERAMEMLVQMADYYLAIGKWEEAIWYYRRLLDFREISNSTRANTLISTAKLYFNFRQFGLAVRHYQQSLELGQHSKDYLLEALSLLGLAAVFVETGQINKATTYLKKIRRMRQQEQDEKLKADVLWLTGRIDRKRQRNNEARDAFEKSLALYRTTGNSESDQILLLCDLSDLCLDLNENQQALSYAAQALEKARDTKSNESRWSSWLAIARAQRASGQTEEALKSYYWAFSLVEKQLIYLGSDSLTLNLLEQRQATYQELTDLLMQLGQHREARKSVEHARARALLELLAKGSGLRVTQEQKEALQESAQRIASIKTEIFTKPKGSILRQEMEKRLKEAELEQEEKQLEIQMSQQKQFTKVVSLEYVQKNLLRPNDIMIDFFLTKDRSYVWIITPDEVTCAALPGQKKIEEKVSHYIKAIAVEPNSLTLARTIEEQMQSARELFDLLLGRFREQLRPGRSLIVVPDGCLSYLPFETLVRDDRYLIEDHNISYIPSASVFDLLKRRGAGRSTHQQDLLAFGAPIFEAPRNSYVNRKSRKYDYASKISLWPNFNNDLPPLPGTLNEIKAISEFFPRENQRIYLGKNATEEALKRELSRSYRYLHLATHSLIDNESPARSGVVLTLDKDMTEDGILQVGEIMDFHLQCHLVVLSACQTGQGRLIKGEGIVGLTRAFLYSGADSAAVSLWSINDISATDFMTRFYKHLAAKESPVVALRQAKLEMVRGIRGTRPPYYWAPFILVGTE